jgi:hypothetical protein
MQVSPLKILRATGVLIQDIVWIEYTIIQHHTLNEHRAALVTSPKICTVAYTQQTRGSAHHGSVYNARTNSIYVPLGATLTEYEGVVIPARAH